MVKTGSVTAALVVRLPSLWQRGEYRIPRSRFHFHEEYVGTAGFDEHLKTPHVKIWDAFVDTDPFVGGKEKGVMGPYKYYAASPAPKEYIGKFQN